MKSFTEREAAEFFEAGWKKLLHRAWRMFPPDHPLCLRLCTRFLTAGRRSVRARALEKQAFVSGL